MIVLYSTDNQFVVKIDDVIFSVNKKMSEFRNSDNITIAICFLFTTFVSRKPALERSVRFLYGQLLVFFGCS